LESELIKEREKYKEMVKREGENMGRESEGYRASTLKLLQRSFASIFDEAEMYELGKGGVQKNESKAIALYIDAINAGDNKSKLKLAEMYATGRGASRSEEAARRYYLEAANAGIDRAQLKVAEMYEQGVMGFERDDIKAMGWYKLAAEKGVFEARNKMAAYKARGIGICKRCGKVYKYAENDSSACRYHLSRYVTASYDGYMRWDCCRNVQSHKGCEFDKHCD